MPFEVIAGNNMVFVLSPIPTSTITLAGTRVISLTIDTGTETVVVKSLSQNATLSK